MTVSTRPDIWLPQNQWVDVYTVTGIAIGSQVTVTNKGSDYCILVLSPTQPTDPSSGTRLEKGVDDNSIEVPSSSLKLWAIAPHGTTYLNVDDNVLQKYKQGSAVVTSVHALGMPFDDAVSLGLVPGVRRQTGVGNNPDVDTTTTPEGAWPNGGIYPWPDSASLITITSNNVADSSTGTGARTVTITGLDSGYNEITETMTLNGASVTSTKQFLRINFVIISSAGSNKVNVGDIDFIHIGSGNVIARIMAGKGTSRSANFTTPLGSTLIIRSVYFSANANPSTINLTISFYVGKDTGYYYIPVEFSISSDPSQVQVVSYAVPEKTDFILRIEYTSVSNANVTAAWGGYLYNNAIINTP